LYELIVGARKIASSLKHAISPARKRSKSTGSSRNAGSPSRKSDAWMWHEFPIHDSNGFAMNVIEQPVEVGDLLRAVLVDHVVVGHRERVGEAEVDLVLARPRLALRRLHLDARAVHAVPDLADEVLVVGRGEDVVVEDVGNRGREILVPLGPRLL
jgi:hypothetical protein